MEQQKKYDVFISYSTVDKMIAAEEYVNQKEYELLTGRFGSINLQEVEEEPEEKSEEIEEPEAYEETKAVEEYQYQEESEEETEEVFEACCKTEFL